MQDTPYDKGLRGLPSGRTGGNVQETDAREELTAWPDPTRPLGIQCNVCIDPFTEANASRTNISWLWAALRR